ncbi:MAG: hypothetical protein KC729_15440, partial [Candidatus Eisenbacteria bacterium]|nr:hypothetical protein [Candidatus Eisenbacteria bacterium]
MTPPTEPVPSSPGRWLPTVALGLWAVVTGALALLPITDPDLGFHIAWGRLLQSDFGAARTETWGQAPGVLRYAYSYWLYQVSTAWAYDHLGPAALVLSRTATILATAALGIALARRHGASWFGCLGGLVLFTAISHERFVDRPDLISHLLWLIAIGILLDGRRRTLWWLVPLQVVWAN